MAEQALHRTGKRGKYQEGAVNLKLSDDGTYWYTEKPTYKDSKGNILAKPEALYKIDTERNNLNKRLNERRAVLIGEVLSKEELTREDREWLTERNTQEKTLADIRERRKKTQDKMDSLVEELNAVQKQKKLNPKRKAELEKERDAEQKILNTTNFEIEQNLNKAKVIEKDVPEHYANLTKNARLTVDYQIGNYTGKKRPQGFNFSEKGKKSLEEAKDYYRLRKPLDDQSKSLRKEEDLSFRRLYDPIRNAKRQRKGGVFINDKLVPLNAIRQVNIDNKGKTTLSGIGLGKKGTRITSYRIDTDTIQKPAFGNEITVNVSGIKRRSKMIGKIKVIGKQPPKSDRIVFKRINGDLVTRSRIEQLFNNSEKEEGHRLLFLNNISFAENSFYKGDDGLWRLQPWAFTELNAPEVEDTIIVRYAYKYLAKYRVLSYEKVTLKGATAPLKTYGEIKTTIMLDGNVQSVVIVLYSMESFVALKQLVDAGKKGIAKSVVATEFTVDKEGRLAKIALNKVETETKGSYVVDTPIEGESKYLAGDRYLIITYKEGYFVIDLRSPNAIYDGLKGSADEFFTSHSGSP